MNLRSLLSLFVVAGLLLSACGGDDGDDVDPALVSALATELASDDAPFTPEIAECASEKIIQGIGVERIAELGVTADNVPDSSTLDFTDGEIDTVVDALGDCGDLSDLMAESLVEDGAIPADTAECFGNEISDDVMKDAFRITLRDPSAEPSGEFFEAFVSAAVACDVPLG